VTSQQQSSGAETARAIRAVLTTYDGQPALRRVAARIRALLQSELYRREREIYAAWIDLGGEA
jgi:hypothetical protein